MSECSVAQIKEAKHSIDLLSEDDKRSTARFSFDNKVHVVEIPESPTHCFIVEPLGKAATTLVKDSREKVMFFDLDNTLYPASLKVDQLMVQKILEYGIGIGIPPDKVEEVCKKYHADYGLSVRGLLRHHYIDPVDYDQKVDGSLPLEQILKPDNHLLSLVKSCKARKWVFTNAGLNHALRVVKLLGLLPDADNGNHLFEGIIYCDYTKENFHCKPEPVSYYSAMSRVGVSDPSLCYLIDDNESNCRAAKNLGWNPVFLMHPEKAGSIQNERDFPVISHIQELKETFPNLF